ncbi:MAG TPA: hypothetical protein VIU64_16365, partial [Polyangia bacterium]
MSRRRILRLLGYGSGTLLALVVLAILVASVVLQGPRLAGLISGVLPQNRGKLEIGGITWSLRALADMVTDVPSPVGVDGLRIIDPEGVVVLDVPHLEARVKLRTLIGGSFSIHDLKIGKAMWRFAQMKDSPGIGFIAALAPAPQPGAPPKKTEKEKKDEAQGPGSLFEITGADIDEFNVLFDFPGSWGLELRRTRVHASLIQSTVDPKHPIFGFDAGPVIAEGGGWLRILDDNLLPFDKILINRVSTTQDRPDDIFLDLREAKTGATSLVGKGYFTGIYGETSVPGIALHAEFHKAADAFNQVIAGKKIEGLALAGDEAHAVLDLNDTFAALKVAAEFSGLEVAYPPYRALDVGFRLGFDAGAMRVTLKDFGLGAPGGGHLGLDATLDAAKMTLASDLRLKAFTTDSFVPTELQPIAGGQLDGHLHADLTLPPGRPSASVRDLDITLERRRARGLPRTIRVHGQAKASPSRVATSGLTVEVPGARATAAGEMNPVRQTVALGLEVLAHDLGRTLGSMGLPRLARTARISARVDGPLTSPTASGEATVTGLAVGKKVVPELRSKFGLDQGVARLESLSGDILGGRLEGHGTLRLFERSAKRPLKRPLLDADVRVHHVDLGAAAGTPDVAGSLSLDAHAEGPLDALTAWIKVPPHQPVTVAGEALDVGPIVAKLDRNIATIERLHVGRRQGGTVELSGTYDTKAEALSLDVALADVPLGTLPGVADAGLGVTGIAGGTFHIGGTVALPELSGTLALKGVHARGVNLGDGKLVLSPNNGAQGPGVKCSGDLFDRLHIDGTAVQTSLGPVVHASASFQKLVLEALLPELSELGDGQGIASGDVQVDLAPRQPLRAEVSLTELALSLARAIEAAPGEPTTRRVEVVATRPVHVVVFGDRVTLDQVDLATTGGDLHARGVNLGDGKLVLSPNNGAQGPGVKCSGDLFDRLHIDGTAVQTSLG